MGAASSPPPQQQPPRVKLTVLVVVVTWLPAALLDHFFGGHGHGAGHVAFIEDYSAHSRLLVAVPILLLWDGFYRRRMAVFARQSAQLLPGGARQSFDKLTESRTRFTDSTALRASLLALTMLVALSFLYTAGTAFAPDDDTWIYEAAGRPTAAGWWYSVVGMPTFVYLTFFWIARFVSWVRAVVALAKQPLRLIPEHADSMGGLEFLSYVPAAFVPMMAAIASVFSGLIAVEVVAQGAEISSFAIETGVFCVGATSILYLPLAAFAPQLSARRLDSVAAYGALVREHHGLFRERWLSGDPPNEPLLRNEDFGSLSDVDQSYQPLQAMGIWPVTKRAVVVSAALVALPFVPLVFVEYSAVDVLKRVAGVLIG